MSYGLELEAFRAESGRLAEVLLDLAPARWSNPTDCPPWSVAELVGHVLVTLSWLPPMLAAAAPDRAEVSAAGYYRPDVRFSASTNHTRVELGQQRAANVHDGHALALEFDETWRAVADLCEREAAGRVVRTRHGDAMLLNDFLLTRVVEVAVHGLDLARALGRTPWLTSDAATALVHLMLGQHGLDAVRDLGWDELAFLRKATGREPLTTTETQQLDRLSIRWLALS